VPHRTLCSLAPPSTSERNSFTGVVPIELGDASALDYVYLNGNDLVGTLDPVFCSVERFFDQLVVDCQGPNPQINCSCCTHCCNADGRQCRPASEATPADTEAADARLARLQELLEPISGQDKLKDESSDQYAAATWMSHSDPTPHDLDNTSPQIIIQEYVMVLLYFSTQGENWNIRKPFLTGESVCSWDGIRCDDGELIISIDFENNNLNGTLVSANFLRDSRVLNDIRNTHLRRPCVLHSSIRIRFVC
jgi:hypothetical protein